MVTGYYIKHTWVEFAGTTGEQSANLNHMETQYDEAVYYYTTVELHGSQYYTKAECDSTFYGPSWQGTGSGFICYMVDGYTADAILNGGVAAGSVAIWKGAWIDIPNGWHACDGRDVNTPNMEDRLPVSCGNNGEHLYTLGILGGSATLTNTGTVTCNAHTLTEAEMFQHNHSFTDTSSTSFWSYQGSYAGTANYGADADTLRTTGTAGGGGSHNHTPAILNGQTNTNLPPCKSYYYIVKE
jgi:microcystin-dependent protein